MGMRKQRERDVEVEEGVQGIRVPGEVQWMEARTEGQIGLAL